MRSPLVLALCSIGFAFSHTAPVFAEDERRTEQGREVLQCVRALHRMADFGIEAFDPDERRFIVLASKFSAGDEAEELGDDEWNYRRSLLRLEKLGRDMIEGKTIPEADRKMLDEYFKMKKHPRVGLGLTDDEVRRLDDLNRQWKKQVQEVADKLVAGESLAEDEMRFATANWASFRSGDQLDWEVIDLSLNVAQMGKSYLSARPKDQHAMRCLLGIRGKADEESVAFIERIIGGKEPIERYDAAITAGKLRPPSDRLISALTVCLDDHDPRVARAAVRSLLSLGAAKSAPAILRRLQHTVDDKETAQLDEKLGFGFDEYGIMDSHIGFRYDLPTELMFAIGRFRHGEALPLLWEIVQGKGEDVWRHEGIYELDHGGVAFEAIVAIGDDAPADVSRRALAMTTATVDALGAAAKVLGENGRLADIPLLIALMSRIDRASRKVPGSHFDVNRAMSRATFAASRLLYFADPQERGFDGMRKALINEMIKEANGPFGESTLAALVFFDPDHVEKTAVTIAADTNAEPNARRIAIEILGKSKELAHVKPLIALFDDEGNATNGPIGLHAAWATAKILSAADHGDPGVESLKKKTTAELERNISADHWQSLQLLRVLYRIDSNRGFELCSSLAMNPQADQLRRTSALEYIALEAQPDRRHALVLRPILDVTLPNARETTRFRLAAARAIAKLLGLEDDESDEFGQVDFEQRVRRELEESSQSK